MNNESVGASPVIELRHVDKHYGALHVLKDINLKIDSLRSRNPLSQTAVRLNQAHGFLGL